MTSTDPSDIVWFKSSYSGSQGDCVEVVFLDGGLTGVRDSKDSAGPALVFSPSEWDAFVDTATSGVLDLG